MRLDKLRRKREVAAARGDVQCGAAKRVGIVHVQLLGCQDGGDLGAVAIRCSLQECAHLLHRSTRLWHRLAVLEQLGTGLIQQELMRAFAFQAGACAQRRNLLHSSERTQPEQAQHAAAPLTPMGTVPLDTAPAAPCA